MSYVDLEFALYRKLLQASEIAALVGDRVYPGELPQRVTHPAIYFGNVDDDPYQYLTSSQSLHRSIYEFGAVANTRAECLRLLELIEEELEGFVGTVTADSTIQFGGCSREPGPINPIENDNKAFEAEIEMLLHWKEVF